MDVTHDGDGRIDFGELFNRDDCAGKTAFGSSVLSFRFDTHQLSPNTSAQAMLIVSLLDPCCAGKSRRGGGTNTLLKQAGNDRRIHHFLFVHLPDERSNDVLCEPLDCRPPKHPDASRC